MFWRDLYLLVHIQLAEDLCRVKQVGVVNDPIASTSALYYPSYLAKLTGPSHVLLDVPRQQGNVEDQRQPVAVDEEQESQEAMYSSLGDDVGVQAVAKVDRVDVVTVNR